MFATFTFFCASVCLFEVVNSQYIGNPFGANVCGAPSSLLGLGLYGLGTGPGYTPITGPCLTLCDIPASNGGGFFISSKSPITPKGLVVQTDSMLMEGPLAVSGQLPFVAVVAFEGPLPALGRGAVAYGCGNGEFGIINELLPTPKLPLYPGPPGYGVAAAPGLGYNGYAR